MDAALMRKGRFGDRIIEIPLPDENALCGILRHHLAGDLAGVDLLPFARSAAGANGADVAAFVRSARRLARNENRALVPDDLMKQIVPEDDRSADDVRRAAYHEAGHCVASAVLVGKIVAYVTIVARGTSGGRTASPGLETAFPVRSDLEDNVTMLLCGRAAEEVFMGHPSVACSLSSHSDLARATECVVAMHTAWGLGKVPVVRASLGQASSLLRADVDLRRTVDAHMAGLYRRALKLVSDHANAVRLIAAELIVERHLDAAGIERILKSAGLDLSSTKPERAVVSGSLVPDPAEYPEGPVRGADAGTRVKKSSNRKSRRLP